MAISCTKLSSSLMRCTALALLSSTALAGIGTTVFSNARYPACCTTAYPGEPCFFRIPVVIAVPGTDVVLAFAEQRGGAAGWGCSDGAGPGVAMKRSIDGGATFGALRYIVNDTDPVHIALKDGVVLGSVIFEPTTQSIFFFYTTCYHACMKTQSYVISSTDAGLTWSDPSSAGANLTQVLETSMRRDGDDPRASFLQFGEGMGVRLSLPTTSNGSGIGGHRLLVCGWYGLTHAANNHSATSFRYDGVRCLASDAGGAPGSWQVTGGVRRTTAYGPNEVSMALLRNGSVLLNLRDGFESHRRWQAVSNDGGESFGEPWETELIGPVSNGAMVGIDGGGAVGAGTQVVFANPHNLEARTNLSVFLLDQDATAAGRDGWGPAQVVYPNGSGYVTSTAVPGSPREVGLLFEADDVASIDYVRVEVHGA